MYSSLTCLSWVLLTASPTNKWNFLTSISPWLYAIPITGIALFLYYRSRRTNVPLPEAEMISEPKPNCKEVVEFDRYAGGHPEINEIINPCVVHVKPDMIQICKYVNESKTEVTCVGRIPMDSVVEMRVEDVFTMKRKMSDEDWINSHKYFYGLNEKKGTDVAFIVIEWIKDKESRFTYLCIENSFAMEIAVKKRNAVIMKTKQLVPQFV